METNQEIYKVYQLLSFFALKHSYNSYFIKALSHNNETFLVNMDNKDYQVIHITVEDLDAAFFDKERIDKIISLISREQKVNVLDIHIGKGQPDMTAPYQTVCIDENYYEGPDVSNCFPGIKNVIHRVDNPQNEINEIVFQLNKNVQTKKRQKRNLMAQSRRFIATYTIIALCIINYLAVLFIGSRGYSTTAAYIIMGADYKMFTRGLLELWRLITTGFCHGSFAHIFFNMYSLFVIGRYFEDTLGKVKYLILIFGSVLCGSLAIGCFTGNTMVFGLSAGIYGLLGYYLMTMANNRIQLSSTFLLMMMANIALNFMAGVAWQAHIGGLVFGIVLYYAYNSSDSKPMIALCLVLLIGLGFKYYQNDNLKPYYGGTDLEVVKFYNDIGLKSLADNMQTRLYNIYTKEGK